MRIPLLLLLPAAIALTACSASPEVAAPPVESSVPSVAASTVSPSPSSTPIAAEDTYSEKNGCEGGFDSNLAILAGGWAIVVASKGESDGPGYVVGFAEDVEDLVDDIDDADCATTEQDVAAANLNLEAQLLALPFNITPPGEGDEEQYQVVAEAAQELAETLGVDDVLFIDVDCKGRVTILRNAQRCHRYELRPLETVTIRACVSWNRCSA